MSGSTAKTTTLLVVDDHIIMREGLVSLLNAQPDFHVVGEAGTVVEAVDLANKLEPDLVLMDYGLPDGTGIEATEEILKSRPESKIIFLTVHESDDELFGALRSGAKGYLLKNIPASTMINKLRGIAHGEAPLSSEMLNRILEEFSRTQKPVAANESAFNHLTPREIDVLRELARGASNQEIADRLFISANTVKNHVHKILEKLEVDNRREAAKVATDNGLI
jgi:DNA-binding NarL/FixJ family response regulator